MRHIEEGVFLLALTIKFSLLKKLTESNSLYYCVFGANGNHSASAIIGTPRVYAITEAAIFSVNIPSGSNFGTLSGVIEDGYLVLSVPNASIYALNYIELS